MSLQTIVMGLRKANAFSNKICYIQFIAIANNDATKSSSKNP